MSTTRWPANDAAAVLESPPGDLSWHEYKHSHPQWYCMLCRKLATDEHIQRDPLASTRINEPPRCPDVFRA